MNYKKILFASDGSEQSLKAAQRLVENQSEWDAEIVIFFSFVHHYPFNSMNVPSALTNPMAMYRDDPNYFQNDVNLTQFGETVLKDTKQIFDDAGFGDKVSTTLIKNETPADYAKHAVEEEGYDLVVLGARGQHSKLREVFLGSVCEEMMNKVQCDVLIVK